MSINSSKIITVEKSEIFESLGTSDLANLKGKQSYKILRYFKFNIGRNIDSSLKGNISVKSYSNPKFCLYRLAYVEFFTPESVLMALSTSGK